jgi:hypothetical protein
VTPEGEREMLRRLARIDRHLRALETLAALAAGVAIFALIVQFTKGTWVGGWGALIAGAAVVAAAILLQRTADRDD